MMANSWFIPKIAPLMVNEANKRGYKIVSTAIAQAIIESRWGESELAKYHNYFGLKCGSKWTGKSVKMKTKEEYTAGKLVTIYDKFRVYDSLEEGVKGYYVFISASRYANLKTATTPSEYAQMLKADQYATDSNYINTLVKTVQNLNLSQYDQELSGLNQGESTSATLENADIPVNGNPYSEPTKNVRLNSKGNDVRWLQYELNQRNYHLYVDGIAGNLTIGALMDFQQKFGLKPDGICGPLTRAALKLKP